MRKILAATVLSTALVFGSVQAEAAKPQPRGIIAFIVKQVRSATILAASYVGLYDPNCWDSIDGTEPNPPTCLLIFQ